MLHTEHLYGHLMGLSGDAKKEFLDNKLFTCEICLPQQEITFKAKSALNRHTKRFHTKEAVKRRALSASPCKAANGKSSRLSKPPDSKYSKRRAPATAPSTPATPVTTLSGLKKSPKSEPAPVPVKKEKIDEDGDHKSSAESVDKVPAESGNKPSADGGNKNPLLKTTAEDSPSKGSANRNPLLMNGVSKSSPLKTPLSSGGIFKQPLSAPRPTKNLAIKSPEARSSLPAAPKENKCNFCQKTFTRESILNVHLEMIHKKEMMEAALKNKENEVEVPSSSAPLVDTKEEEVVKEVESPVPMFLEAKEENEEESENSSAKIVEDENEEEETTIEASKDDAPAKEETTSNITSDEVTTADTASTSSNAPAASVLTNGCDSEDSELESEEEVFMEVEEEDIDLTNHPNLVEKRPSGVVVDKEWKGAYLSRKKADADAPSEENKRISARLRDRVNVVAKRKEISRETPPPVAKKRRKKEAVAEVVKKVPQELTEECLYSEEQWGGCKRKFYSYFSMMRHVAFVHRPERTVEMMGIKSTAQPIKNPAMPILMGAEAKKSEGEGESSSSAGASEGAPESASSTTASVSGANEQDSSHHNKGESPGNGEQSSLEGGDEIPGTEEKESSSSSPNDKTQKEESDSREEDVKAVIEGMVDKVVRGEEPSPSDEHSSEVCEEAPSNSPEEELSGNGSEATAPDDVLPEADEEPSSGTTESSEDIAKGVSDATEKPDATAKPDAKEKSEAIQDAPKADLLDDTLEMEVVATASSEVVAAAN